MTKIRVLVADDHAILRDGIRALLTLYDDIEVIGEASNGKEAIDTIRELLPDVVLMDIAMPFMDGLEVTRRVHKENPKVKILILTQHDNREYILSSIKSGATGYIPKKAVTSELVDAIRVVYRGDSYLYPSVASVLIGDYIQRLEHDPYDRLTNREREVLKLIAEARTSREIADLLCISVKTVLAHRAKTMEKLGIHNRTELVKYTIRKGLITIDT